MSKFYGLLTLLVLSIQGFSQPYLNEWIDYSKTYYRFPVTDNRLYRIPQTTLDAAGLGNTPVEHFQLWRNGKEEPIYITQTSGILAGNGFIEFMGRKNDGELDKELFANPADHLNKETSYFSDTAWYYLTIQPGSNNKRIAAEDNLVSSTALPADSFFMFNNIFQSYWYWNQGAAVVVAGTPVRSSLLNAGEGWAAQPFNNWAPLNFSIPNLQFSNKGPKNFQFSYSVSGNYPLQRNIEIRLRDSLVAKTFASGYTMRRDTINNLPVSLLQNDALSLRLMSDNPFYWENIYLNVCALRYPRKFSFGGAYFFELELPSSAHGNHLRLHALRSDNQPIVIYDLTNQRRYLTQLKGDSALVLLKPSAIPRKIVAANQVFSATNITNMQPRVFQNFNLASNQGDFLIISTKRLNADKSGGAVDAYRQYRISAEGGSYKAQVYDIDELAEQFAQGMRRNPLAVRNFVRFALAKFQQKPRFVFLIGRASYYEALRGTGGFPETQFIASLPTFGTPGSDNMLVAADNSSPNPLIPIGRLSAVNEQEVEVYLEKVKSYEKLAKSDNKSGPDLDWKKEVIHLVGGDDAYLASIVRNFLNRYGQFVSDTSISARVGLYQRINNPQFANEANAISRSMDSGVALITYFGHSSATSIDFNITQPEEYKNSGGKYPIFIANGCRAGNIFDYNFNRLVSKNQSISENFIFAKDKGSIAFISNSDLGVINYMHLYTNEFYRALAKTAYGKSLGEIQQQAIAATWRVTGPTDQLNRINLEQVILHSDPAIVPFPYPKPDYTTSDPMIQFIPDQPNAASDSVWVQVRVSNIGRAIGDSVNVTVQHEAPNGKISLLYSTRIPRLNRTDSIRFKMDVKGILQEGENKIIATADPENEKEEMAENNNQGILSYHISSTALVPVFPYDLSIVNNASVKLIASTPNPAAKSGQYRFQVDTSRYFNSPALISIDTISIGGALSIQPALNWKDNTVYYWRTSPIVAGIPAQWKYASFLYDKNLQPGFNQSHFFQHQQSTLARMRLPETSRRFEFGDRLHNVFVEQGIYPTSGFEESHFSVMVNGIRNIRNACIGSSILFNVMDGNTLKLWDNSTGGRFGSAFYCGPGRETNFEFYYYSSANRKAIMDFLDAIPQVDYVVARMVLDPPHDSAYAHHWQRDTLLFGKNNSLYHALKRQGFYDLDSLNRPRTFSFVFKKDDTVSFKPVSRFSQGLFDRILTTAMPSTRDSLGWITSPVFGPSNGWQSMLWQPLNTMGSANRAVAQAQLFGGKSEDQLVLIDSFTTNQLANNLIGYSASQYPYMQLRMRNLDTVNAIPWNLNNWRITYQPVADGALSAADHWKWNGDTLLAIKDTLALGIAFKNVSRYPMGSTPYTLFIGKKGSEAETILKSGTLPALNPQDTAVISYKAVTDTMFGDYYLKLLVNDNRSPVEQTYFNNYLLQPLYVDSLKNSVELIGFQTNPSAGGVQATWQVAYEIKVARYELLYGKDSLNMQVVLTENPLNNAAANQSYLRLHSAPVFGKNYYRLRITDRFGFVTTTAAQEIEQKFLNYTAAMRDNGILNTWNFRNEMNMGEYRVQAAQNQADFNTLLVAQPLNNGGFDNSYTRLHTKPVLGNNKYRIQYTDAVGGVYNTLPFEFEIYLVGFEAKANGKEVETKWSFMNELNIKDYVVEWGQDSSKLKVVNTTVPAGNDAGIHNYSFTHKTAPLGYNYYRLKVSDGSGNTVYSAIQKVFVGDATTVIIYPNPFGNELRMVTGDNNSSWEITLYDAVGRLVLSKTGTGSVTLNTTTLLRGNYFLRFKKNGEEKVYKFQKR
jgi:hypothetical protein